jgi:hypothetical protein
MGPIDRVLGVLFGGAGNVVKETAEVFRENAEGRAVREARLSEAALAQFAAEFVLPKQGFFDRVVDGLNRLPRARHWRSARCGSSWRRWWTRCGSRRGCRAWRSSPNRSGG